jgi:hypothetical protein
MAQMPAQTLTRIGRVGKEQVSESVAFLCPIPEREPDEQCKRLGTNVERPGLPVRDHGRGPEETEHRPIIDRSCARACARPRGT